MANGNFGGGVGSSEFPFIVEDARDFWAMRNYPTGRFIQVADIDFANYASRYGSFNGFVARSGFHYNGNGYVIRNVTCTSTDNTGLFITLSGGSTLDNIHVKNGLSINTSSSSNARDTGGLVGNISAGNSHIINCSFEGVVSSQQNPGNCGGLVGSITTHPVTIRNSYFKGEVVANSNSSINTGSGGFIGSAGSSANGVVIENCYSDAKITSAHVVGGFVGDVRRAVIRNCYSMGEVSGIAQVGGFTSGLHSNASSIRNCFSLVSKIKRRSGTSSGFGRFSQPGFPGILENCFVLDTMVFEYE